ncbi:Cas10/Cmr2 second palm domain-containing protein [Clostridium luticellarii]|uniref:CRISPR-associated protein n=1 Tax=Clostridium luticellarii TaxID=1691940 RepID=A0A2T0B612_9CLOT|nr:type III-B CRISPR-associated protein Cas10/Cmr2 [Clostridium luticellarii]PRR79331.1 CRISPR-associated protein [Clostridium luticellarii]
MKYLLAVTLGPVQSYIEESEKLMDLRNSSMIISKLMKNIIEEIYKNDSKSELIYPKYGKDSNFNSIKDCTNYLVFEVSEKEKLKLSNLEDSIYKNMGEECDIENFKEIFYLFWAVESIDDKDYYDVYNYLQELMNGIKHTYVFNNRIQSQERKYRKEKCYICGKRPIYKEDLCSVCYCKRKYNKDNYESNYSIAIKTWKETYQVKLQNVNKLLKEFFTYEDKYYSISEIEHTISMLKNADIKGSDVENKKYKDFSFDLKSEAANELRQKNLSKEFLIEKLQKIESELKSHYESKDKTRKVPEPNYKYAFIQFDIDSLGDWMRGEFTEIQREKFKSYQEQISSFLISFGERLREELDVNCNVIYSGGDDFLAVMPIEIVCKVLNDIDRIFTEDVLNKLKSVGISEKMTYSTCITIAPCKAPIGEVINKSRIELNNVKDRYERDRKNGVVLNYIVGDGAATTAYMKKDKLNNFLDLIEKYIKIKNKFSLSFIRKYEKEFSGFAYNKITNDDFRNLRYMSTIELSRIVKKSKLFQEEKGQKEAEIQEYIKEMKRFMDSLFYENCMLVSANRRNVDFKNYLNTMDIYERLCSLQGFYEITGGDVNETFKVETL